MNSINRFEYFPFWRVQFISTRKAGDIATATQSATGRLRKKWTSFITFMCIVRWPFSNKYSTFSRMVMTSQEQVHKIFKEFSKSFYSFLQSEKRICSVPRTFCSQSQKNVKCRTNVWTKCFSKWLENHFYLIVCQPFITWKYFELFELF